MFSIHRHIRARFVFVLAIFALSIASRFVHAEQDERFYPQTGYRIANDSLWNYFKSRGGINTFGYPVSDLISYQGLSLQIFQRHVLEVTPQGARPLNLLDPQVMPLTQYGGLTFPAYDAALAVKAPTPDTPDYGQAVLSHLEQNVPEQWEGQAVSFRSYYMSAAPAQSTPALRALLALEVWGFPTSRPQHDPNNQNFIYQRFQRGIMHYERGNRTTHGILLGDAFKQKIGSSQTPPMVPTASDNTIIFYATQYQSNWALRSSPKVLLSPIFDHFYGTIQASEEIELSYLNYSPVISPNGRLAIVPGLSPSPNGAGTGTWWIDLSTGNARQLSPQALIVTWNPLSSQITYIENGTLYIRQISEQGVAKALFKNPELDELFARWSPDGKWIAVVTVSQTEKDQNAPNLAKQRLWLIPTDGSAPRQIAQGVAYPVEHAANEIEWSFDSQFLVYQGAIIDVSGKQICLIDGFMSWVQRNILKQSGRELQLVGLEGNKVATITEVASGNIRIVGFAFSMNGQKIAYTLEPLNGPSQLFVFDFTQNKNTLLLTLNQGNIPRLAWSADNQSVIYQTIQNNQRSIWQLSLTANSEPVKILDGVLVGTGKKP